MSEVCQMIVFSNKVYNAIIRESFDKDSVETGGILLGHILDNGIWVVMEVLPPGINCIFETAYFEYDDAFVNYLAQSVANQYKIPLCLLGLWHRHPGSMDFFSTTDDQTNETFAVQNSCGVISGLVNIDPRFRLTMYHMDNPVQIAHGSRPNYEEVPITVGDDIIPERYFELRYYDGKEENLHPCVESGNVTPAQDVRDPEEHPISPKHHYSSDNSGENKLKKEGDAFFFQQPKCKVALIILLLVFSAISIRVSWRHLKTLPKHVIECGNSKIHVKDKKTDKSIPIRIGDTIPLREIYTDSLQSRDFERISSNDSIVVSDD